MPASPTRAYHEMTFVCDSRSRGRLSFFRSTPIPNTNNTGLLDGRYDECLLLVPSSRTYTSAFPTA